MKSALLDLLPVFGGDDVAQGIGEVMLDHFGHPRGAGGEVDQHDVADLGGLLPCGPGKLVGEPGDLLLEAEPALPLVHHQDAVLQTGSLGHGGLHLVDDRPGLLLGIGL